MNFNYSSKHTDVKTTGVNKIISQKLLENFTINYKGMTSNLLK